MPISTHSSLGSLLLAILAGLNSGFVSGRAAVGWTDAVGSPNGNAYLLSFGVNQDDIQNLIDEQPVRRSLRSGESYSLRFAVQEVNHTLPDMLVSVRATTGTGDVDLYCLPLKNASEKSPFPGPANYVWGSNHTSGMDYIFASRDHVEYTVMRLTLNNGQRTVRGAALSCAVLGVRYGNPNSSLEFELRLEVDYRRRTNVPKEQNAMSSLFKKCCKKGTSCVRWRNGNVDVCHLRGSVCDSDGFLIRLSMQHFGLDCRFPVEEVSQLSRLEKLELGWNNIGGNVNEIGQKLFSERSRLEHFGMRDNRLVSLETGNKTSRQSTILCKMVRQRLSFIDLRNNRVGFTLPSCLFSSESNLEELYLSGNPFTGMAMPGGVFLGSKIRVIDMASTGLVGTIPMSLGTAPQLQVLDLSGNNLTGRIPKTLGRNPALEFLNLGRNELDGKIPNSFAASASLKVLWLNDNFLTGLPSNWNGNREASEALVDVILAGNQIQSQFPVPLAKAKKLLRLHIGDNLMSGALPNQRGLFPRAVHINLANNSFEGSVPLQWSTLGMFAFLNGMPDSLMLFHKDTDETIPSVLDISNNGFSGLLPRFLVDAYVSKRVQVYLDGNMDLLCVSLVNQSCGEYFADKANPPDRSSRIALARVDALYVKQTRDMREDESGLLGDMQQSPGLRDTLPSQSASSGFVQSLQNPNVVVASQTPGFADKPRSPRHAQQPSDASTSMYFWLLVAIGIVVGVVLFGAVIATLIWKTGISSKDDNQLVSSGSDMCCVLLWRGSPRLNGGSAPVPKAPDLPNSQVLKVSTSRTPALPEPNKLHPAGFFSAEHELPQPTRSLSWTSAHGDRSSPTSLSSDRQSLSHMPQVPMMGEGGTLPALRVGCVPPPENSGNSVYELRGNMTLPAIRVHKGKSKQGPSSVDAIAVPTNQPDQPSTVVDRVLRSGSSKPQSSESESAGSLSPTGKGGAFSPSLNGWLTVAQSPGGCSATSTELSK